jgi:uridine kinase
MIIGISGGSGSGKTTLAKRLIHVFGDSDVRLIQQDSYYKDRSHLPSKERKKINFDIPDAFDFECLIRQLREIREGNRISVPVYSFKTHTRTKKKQWLSPGKIVILEGILLFHEKAIRDLCDLKIFLDIEENLRFERRLRRDQKERGRSRESVLKQWEQSVQPMYEKYVMKLRKWADVVFQNDPTPKDMKRLSHLIEDHLHGR